MDLGCGTGQLTRQLAPHFQEVVGFDISEAQLEEARTVAGYSNVTYRWETNKTVIIVIMSVGKGLTPY